MGILISPVCGPNQRISVIYTSAKNLPFAAEVEVESAGPSPHAWVSEFCSTCGNCVRKCPAKAILAEPRKNDAGDGWSETHIDGWRCSEEMGDPTKHACGVCIRECAFFKVGYERLHEEYVKRKQQ
jgi:epoxyqueuosine reductase